MPVDCVIHEEKDLDGNSLMTVKPFNQLKNDTCYAVLLANNVPTGRQVTTLEVIMTA
jgi:hypothetical protein